jgi:hypothetical protein
MRAVQIPAAIDWMRGVDRASLGPLGNAYDPAHPERPVMGDCGPVGMYRIIQGEQVATGVPMLTGDQLWPCVLQAYEEIGRYVLGDPATDQGIVLIDGLKHWLNVGLPMPGGTRHRCLGFFQLDVRQLLDLHQAIAECGNVYTGQEIPSAYDSSVQGDTWDLDGPGAGGHCTPSLAYAPGLIDMESWAMRFPETERARLAYMDECYTVVLPNWAKATGLTPFGMTLDEVSAAMKHIAAAI